MVDSAPGGAASPADGYARLDHGLELLDQGRAREAAQELRQAVALFEELGESADEAAARTNLGNALRLAGDLDAAIGEHTRARELYTQEEDRLGRGQVSGNLAGALASAGRVRDAVAASREAVELFVELGESADEAAARTNLARALELAGDLAEAAEEYEILRGVRESEGDKPGAAAALDRRLTCLERLGGSPPSAQEYRRLAVLGAEVRDRGLRDRSWRSAGVAHCQAREFTSAVEALERGSAADTEDPQLLHYYGVALLEVGRSGDAVPILQRVVRKPSEETGDNLVAEAHNNLGAALHEQERYVEAVPHYELARDRFHEAGIRGQEGLALLNLSDVLIAVGRNVEAMRNAVRAAEVFAGLRRRAEEGEARLRVGEARLALGRRSAAVAELEQAIAILTEAGDTEAADAAETLLAAARRS
jgi:tetratricopeptide (TPR) repeat protein